MVSCVLAAFLLWGVVFLMNLVIFHELETKMIVIIQMLAGEDSSAAVDI